MKEVLFPFDSPEGIIINVLKDHQYSEVFSQRYDKEKLLRQSVAILYENSILSRNKNMIDYVESNTLPQKIICSILILHNKLMPLI